MRNKRLSKNEKPKYVLVWRIETVCRHIIETAKLIEKEISEGLTYCPIEKCYVTIDRIINRTEGAV